MSSLRDQKVKSLRIPSNDCGCNFAPRFRSNTTVLQIGWFYNNKRLNAVQPEEPGY